MTIQNAVAFAITESVLFGAAYCFSNQFLGFCGIVCACLFVKRAFYPHG